MKKASVSYNDNLVLLTEQNKSYSMFERLRNVFHKEPRSQTQIEIEPEHNIIVPYIFQYQAKATHAELFSKFCSDCKETPELLAAQNNLALLGCSKTRCEHRLFRMDILN